MTINYWVVPALADSKAINNTFAADVIRAANARFNVKITERTRKREICDVRQIVCYVLRNSTDLSTTNIGSMLHLDHATVLYGARQAETLLNTDKHFRQKYQPFVDEYLNKIND